MGRDRNNPLDREDREGPEIIASGPSYPSPYTTGLLNDVLYAPTAERASLHARSQRLQASAHTRQCSMFISVAWCSHSSPHSRHASAQAWRAALTMAGSNSVCLETILPVAAHTSEQLRHKVMQRLMWPTISSPRHASAQAVQLWAQSKHASMHSTRSSASIAAGP